MTSIREFVFQDRIAFGFRPSNLDYIRLFIGSIQSQLLFQYRFLNLRHSACYNEIGGGKKRVYNAVYGLVKHIYIRMSEKANLTLPVNTAIDGGLMFPHGFPLVINPMAKIGKNCIIHPCVLIGRDRGKEGAPVIGDNCFIGHGAKIIGNPVIGNWCFISPAAVVTKDIPEGSLVGAGVNKILNNEGKKHVMLYLRN